MNADDLILFLLTNNYAKMKRIVKIAMAVVPLFLIPVLVLNAQENGKEKHIKVVMVDNAGNKVQLDTLIKGEINSDSIKLKNGEIIYLSRVGKPGKNINHVSSETMIVTSSSDEKSPKEKQKKIIIVTDDGDSSKLIEHGDVVIVNAGNHKNTGEGQSYAFVTSKSGGSGSKFVYVDEDKSTGDKNNNVEKSKFVIAKDGIVVTVEGNDEAKAKEVIEAVKAKLGVNKEDKSGKDADKETKKAKKE
jgi:hypothetical protein